MQDIQNYTPERNPEVLSAETEKLIMPHAVDSPVDPEQADLPDIIGKAGQVGITTTAGEIRVEPVEEDASVPAELDAQTDSPVRKLPEGHMWFMTQVPPPRRRGGGGAWWYIKKYLRIPGISDKDDD